MDRSVSVSERIRPKRKLSRSWLLCRDLSKDCARKMSQSKLQEHWRKPKNTKSLVDADGIGRASNPVYGDTLELCIKVKGDTIMDASFKALGCKEAVAVCSFVTEMIKSKPLS